jgi:hypothetical protein
MFYTIYKVTNRINGKIYIGKHQTKDLNDGYMGSGKHLRYSVSKHGIENFTKEILFVFDNEQEMNAKEAEIVTREFCLNENTYNLCPGGNGGWGYLNDGSESHLERAARAAKKGGVATRESNQKKYGVNSPRSLPSVIEKTLQTKHEKYGGVGFQLESLQKKRHRSVKEKYGIDNISQHPEVKAKIKQTFCENKHQQGSKNSQYGSFWITDGKNNRKIKKDESIPTGWYKGRKLNKTLVSPNGEGIG